MRRSSRQCTPGRAEARKWTNIIILFPPFNRLIRCAAASLPLALRSLGRVSAWATFRGKNECKQKYSKFGASERGRKKGKRNNNGIWPEHLFAYFVIIYIRLMESDSVGRQITPAPPARTELETGTRKSGKAIHEIFQITH